MLRALAALWLNVLIEVFVAIVVGDLLTGADLLRRHDVDMAHTGLWFRVRNAGVVYVSGLIPLRLSVEDFSLPVIK